MERLHVSRAACGTLALAFLLGSSGPLLALGEEFVASDPPPPEIKCSLNQNDMKVSTFGGVFGYNFKGNCTVTFPGTKTLPLPAGSYEVMASWTESSGMVNETLKGRD